MKKQFALLLFLALCASALLHAEQAAVVSASRINVRGQPKLQSEVVTQLERGDSVVVLETIPDPSAQAREPKNWAKIKLPANTPVWVFAPFIKEGEVAVSRLNVRAGPGENYSILGTLERGTDVKQIRAVEAWMEIETPEQAYAFVDSTLLDIKDDKTAAAALAGAAAAPSASGQAARQAAQSEAVPAQSQAKPEPASSVVARPSAEPSSRSEPEEPTPAQDALAAASAAPSATGEAAAKAAEAPAPQLPAVAPAQPKTQSASTVRRVVRRQGLVRPTRSIQAPTAFELVNPQTKRTINYLFGENIGVNLAEFRGMNVVVTGEEGLDSRWPNIPVLQLESIDTAP